MTIYQLRYRVKAAIDWAGGYDDGRVATADDVDAMIAIVTQALIEAKPDVGQGAADYHGEGR